MITILFNPFAPKNIGQCEKNEKNPKFDSVKYRKKNSTMTKVLTTVRGFI